jgi:hypothetical protein
MAISRPPPPPPPPDDPPPELDVVVVLNGNYEIFEKQLAWSLNWQEYLNNLNQL